MKGYAGSADRKNGQFAAILSQIGEVQFTRKLQGTPGEGLLDMHDAEISL